MKIIVCVKQVPDTEDIKWTENNTIQREGLESIINPYDVYALESALKLKSDNPDTKITTLTMGPPQATSMLKQTIAKGADEGVLLSDKKFAASDTYATSKIIGTAIKEKLSDFDLIICGQFAVDGDTAQTGPSIANFLDIPQVTYVQEILSCDNETLKLRREIDDGTEIVSVKLPALICVLKDYFEPTRAKINGIIKAQGASITTWGFSDLSLDENSVGLKGSPTYVGKAFRPEPRDVDCQICTSIDDFVKNIKTFGGLE